jgi:hypothetical protein
MWERGYEDEIEGFVISNDNRHVALLGKKYHYILDDKNGNMTRDFIVAGQDLVFIDSEKTHLKLNSNNIIFGHLAFESFDEQTLSAQNLAVLRSLGFMRDKEDNLKITIEVEGRRYLPNESLVKRASLFKNASHLEIHQPNGVFAIIEKTIATPITLTADAFLFVGEAALKIVEE